MVPSGKMNETEQRYGIKISVIQGKQLRAALGAGALFYSIVKHWAALITQVRDSCENDPEGPINCSYHGNCGHGSELGHGYSPNLSAIHCFSAGNQ